MQAHFLSASILVLTLAAAAPAAALVPELPICGHCGADAGGANAAGSASPSDVTAPQTESSLKYHFSGIDGAASEQAGPPDQVQAAPAEAQFDMFIRLGGVEGDSEEPPPPPPPPPPQNAPTAEHGVQAQAGGTPALIVPAVQRVRESASRGAPAGDGVVVLDTTLPQQDPLTDGLLIIRSLPPSAAAQTPVVNAQPQRVVPEIPICGHCAADVTDVQSQNETQQTDGVMILRYLFGAAGQPEAPPTRDVNAEAQAQTDGLMILRAAEGEAVVPEMPICAHCSSDVAAQQPAAATETPAAPAERRRGGFSLSIGGITVGSGGVSVAAGDIDGDSRSNRTNNQQTRPASRERR